ncbi:hypothetical protein [Undibacterium macrobrachii]|uniref:Uncharacterized protein n=1 Tax=Undibacterium macrobrachii TaxID=1119058 RepID=A0ABQ2X6J2_9BURK|nr:hypothetical protein [Undibacterium macrobrachii]GGX01625.1 hypothetical protein GCM10011282_04460 [Undibacterium macrobrachii]
MSLGTDLRIGQSVAFRCHILGELQGQIKHLMPCISNGQQHALIRVVLDSGVETECLEPVVNLTKV